MASKKISVLTEQVLLTGNEYVPIVSPVTDPKDNKKVTIDNLMQLAPVQSVNGQTGTIVLDAADVGAVAPGANISVFTNDVGYTIPSQVWKTSGVTTVVADTTIYGPSNNSAIVFDNASILGPDGVFIGSGDVDNFITKRSWVAAYGTGDFAQIVQQTSTTNHYAQVSAAGVDLYSESSAGVSVKLLIHPVTGAVFTDSRATKVGIQYAADYSPTFTNETLVTKRYVDTTIVAGPFWPLTGTGTLTGNTTITGGAVSNKSIIIRTADGTVFPNDSLSMVAGTTGVRLRHQENSTTIYGLTLSSGTRNLSATDGTSTSSYALDVGGLSMSTTNGTATTTLGLNPATSSSFSGVSFDVVGTASYVFTAGTSSVLGLSVSNDASIHLGAQDGGGRIQRRQSGGLYTQGLKFYSTVANALTVPAFEFDINTGIHNPSGNWVMFGINPNGAFTASSGINAYTLFQVTPKFNLTSTYTGTTRGIYYNPTLTSHVGTHIGIEIASGLALFAGTVQASGGTILIGTASTGGAILTSGNDFYVSNQNASGSTFIRTNNLARISITNTGVITTSHDVTSASTTAFNITGSFINAAGTNSYGGLSVRPTYNTTGTYSGTGIGIDYNPTLTSVIGLTHIALRATSGSVIFGGTDATAGNYGLLYDNSTQNVNVKGYIQAGRNFFSARQWIIGAPDNASPSMWVNNANAAFGAWYSTSSGSGIGGRANGNYSTTQANADISFGFLVTSSNPAMVINPGGQSNYNFVIGPSQTLFAANVGDVATATTRLDIRAFSGTSGGGLRVAKSDNSAVIFSVDNSGVQSHLHQIQNSVSHNASWNSSANGSYAFAYQGTIGANGVAGNNITYAAYSMTMNATNTGQTMYGIALNPTFGNYGTQSPTGIAMNISSGITASAGTGTFKGLELTPTYNTTSTYAGVAYGIDYNPTTTSVTGLTHIAARFNSGSVLVGKSTLGVSTARMEVASTAAGNAILILYDGANTITFQNGLPAGFEPSITTSSSTILKIPNGVGTSIIQAVNNNFVRVRPGGNGGNGLEISPLSAYNTTSASLIQGSANFNPSSGTATFKGLELSYTLNTTGTYSGTTYGIDYNPTLTSVTGLTHYAIRTSSGQILFANSSSDTVTSNTRLDVRGVSGQNVARFASAVNGALMTIADNGIVALSILRAIGSPGFGIDFGTGRDATNGFLFGPLNVWDQANANNALISIGSGASASYTSGTNTLSLIRFNNVINTSGTSTNTIRGIYYNPTLTSTTGTTHIAIETTSGNVIFNGGAVGIGTTPAANVEFHLKKDQAGDTTLRIENSQADSAAVAEINFVTTAGNAWIYKKSATAAGIAAGSLNYQNLGSGDHVFIGSSETLRLKYDTQIEVGNNGNDITITSGSYNLISTLKEFAPTSGTGSYTDLLLSPTWNTTGTYTGTVRGLYYNPTNTSLTGATHIAFENTSGQIRFGAVTNDDTKTRFVVIDATTGQLFYRSEASLPSGGTFTGTAGTLDNAIVRADTTAGTILQGSNVLVTDAHGIQLGTTSVGSAERTITTVSSSGSTSMGLVMQADGVLGIRNNSATGMSINISGQAAIDTFSINLFSTSHRITGGAAGKFLELLTVGSSTTGVRSGDMRFTTGNATTGNADSGHFSFDTGTKAGTGKVGSISIFNHTGSYGGGEKVVFVNNATLAPSSNPADGFLFYSADISASAVPHFRNEAGDIIKLYAQAGWAAATGTATRTTYATGTVTLSQLAERVKALIDDLLTVGFLKA